ncbi:MULTISPECIES: TolC family protein [unclassified Melioribacter]|uniref:TolC family protein n=1 Tax=unclassified Melioribacter TaxID=2627329 RepID=UPI003BDE8DB8
MKKILILILFASSLFAQERILTLKECLEIGLQNSKDLKISQSRINFSEAKLSEINSQFLPQFKLFGNYTRLSDNIPAFEFSSPLFPSTIRISEPLYNNYTFKFGFTQPLFTGFKLLSSRSAAKYNLQASESDYSKDANEAAFNIYSAYWNYYKASEIRDVIEHTLKQIESHLKDTRNFYEQGLVPNNDLLKLEVKYSNTKLMLIEAENNLKIARIALNKALGIELDSQIKVSGAETSLENVNYDLSEILNEALNNRQELKSLAYRVQSSEEGISAAKSNWLPSIYLSGNYYYSNPNPRFLPAKDEFNYNWDVGVTLSWDVWNWGLTSSQVSQAEQTKIQLETNYDQLKENIQMEVHSNYLNLLKTEEKVKVNKIALEQASENYRITAEKYNLQLATSTDLIDAETLKLQAETNLKTAEVDYQLAKVRLEKSLGRRIY